MSADNIYAIATATAKKAGYSNFDKGSDGEEKREEIVLALKRRGMKKSDDAREAAKYQARKPETSIMEQRKPADTPKKDPNRVKGGEWKGGKWISNAVWEIWKTVTSTSGVMKAKAYRERPADNPGSIPDITHTENPTPTLNPTGVPLKRRDRRKLKEEYGKRFGRDTVYRRGKARQVSDRGKPHPDDPNKDAPLQGERRGIGFKSSSESETTKPKKKIGFKVEKATYGAKNDQARHFGQRTNVKRNPRLNPNKLGVSDIIKAGLPKQAPLRKPKIVEEGKEEDLYPTGSQFSVDRKDQVKKSLLGLLLKW